MGKTIKPAVLIFLFLMLPFTAGASAVETADSAYNAGDFELAAQLYEDVVAKEGSSAALLYNLGNSYYRLGKEGEAMLCYERAKKLDPGNKLIKNNLAFLRSKVLEANKGSLQGKGGNMEADRPTFMDNIYRMIAEETQSNLWAVFAVMAFILFLGGVAMYVFTPNVLARKTGFFSGLVFLFFTVVFLTFTLMGASQYERTDEAVLIEYTSQLHERPEMTSRTVTTPLHKGTKLKVLEEKEGSNGSKWLKVKLNSDNIGWIEGKSVEKI